MTVTRGLNAAFVGALGDVVEAYTGLDSKPFEVDLALPLPPRLRVYMYSLVAGGNSRQREMKAVLRVPAQKVGEYASFDFDDDRFVLLVGYDSRLEVFVLWDAVLHERFKHGGNVQVKRDTVTMAAAIGTATQRRRLKSGVIERVLACRSEGLASTLLERHSTTGGEHE